MPISTVDRERVRLRNQAAFILTSEDVTENGGIDDSGGGGGADVDELLTWVAMKARRRRDKSSFATWSHLYDSIVKAVTVALNKPAWRGGYVK
jgi:hypothetical protein